MAPCIYSAYRPPAYGVGGFANKFDSAHAYGLAVDLKGIGDPGSRETMLWRKIAAADGVYMPYSAYSRAEWNHAQPTRYRMVCDEAPLRRTITANGPKDIARMWKVAEAIISPVGIKVRDGAPRHHYVHRYRHRHYASAS